MIKLNFINNNLLQIIGTSNRFSVSGIAHRIYINSTKKVWCYDIKILRHPKLIKIASNKKDGTISNIDKLLEKIENICLEERIEYDNDYIENNNNNGI